MELHYRKMGEGKPLFILHGLFGSSDNWQTHAKKLAEYFTVYLIDQRNHGHSPWSDTFNYPTLANDLQKVVEKEGIEEAIFLGHSMGGKTVMHYAQKHPEKVTKLIVVDMGIKGYPIHHDTIIEGLQSLDLNKISSRGEAEEALSTYIDNWSIRQFLLKNLYWVEKGKLGWRINIPVLSDNMNEIVAPLPAGEVMIETLFMRGGQSNYILEEDKEAILEQFPLAKVYSIEKAGHWIHAEAPEEFLETVIGFCLR